MSTLDRVTAEHDIERALLQQWDPLGVADASGEHAEYQVYAARLYDMLAAGSSDLQVVRFLHRVEGAELGHPELATRDLGPLSTTLRAIERQI